MDMKKLCTIVFGGVLAAAVSGCGGKIGGRREHIPVIYFGGELEAALEAPLTKVEPAAQQVLRDMGFRITSREAQTFGARVIADNPRTKKHVVVIITQTEQKTVELGIRVDSFGDKKLSNEILEAIKAKLETAE
jgi:hypothetical protein